MEVNKCRSCGRDRAFIADRNSGVTLCPSCFSKSFEKRFERAIEREKALRPVGKVLVALSGSVSSLVLALLLERVESKFPYVELVFVHLRRWREKYEEENVVNFYRKNLTSKLEIFPIENLLGISSFEELIGDAFASHDFSCVICRALTRRAIFKAARKLDASCIVFGDTLEEYLADKLINLWLIGTSRDLGASFREKFPKGVKVSRPLLFATSKEVELYSEVTGLRVSKIMCSYKDHVRHRVMRILSLMEERSPGMLLSFLRASTSVELIDWAR